MNNPQGGGGGQSYGGNGRWIWVLCRQELVGRADQAGGATHNDFEFEKDGTDLVEPYLRGVLSEMPVTEADGVIDPENKRKAEAGGSEVSKKKVTNRQSGFISPPLDTATGARMQI